MTLLGSATDLEPQGYNKTFGDQLQSTCGRSSNEIQDYRVLCVLFSKDFYLFLKSTKLKKEVVKKEEKCKGLSFWSSACQMTECLNPLFNA